MIVRTARRSASGLRRLLRRPRRFEQRVSGAYNGPNLTYARRWPNLVTGRSRSSRAPPELPAFNSFRAHGLSSEPSLASIETPTGKGFRNLNHQCHTWIYIASTQLLIRRLAGA